MVGLFSDVAQLELAKQKLSDEVASLRRDKVRNANCCNDFITTTNDNVENERISRAPFHAKHAQLH